MTGDRPSVSYASFTRDAAEPLKRLAHGRRFQQAVRLIAPAPTDTVLDYGCADAHLFTLFESVPAAQLVAYDPDPKLLAQMDPRLRARIRVFSDRAALLDQCRGAFSLIVCMEVCEHLTAKALGELLDTVMPLAAPGARLVFGVPIETGPAGFLKNLYRLSKGRRQGATLGLALRALFGRPIERPVTDVEWHGSHIGFDHQAFRGTLERRGLAITGVCCLPFPWLGPALNNEIYFTCRAR